MTSFDRVLQDKKISLAEDNTLPRGERTLRHVRRLIAAVRACEAGFNDSLHEAEEATREAQAEALKYAREVEALKDANRQLADQLKALQVGAKLEQLEVSVGQREALKQLVAQ